MSFTIFVAFSLNTEIQNIQQHKHKQFTRETVTDSQDFAKKIPNFVCGFKLSRFHPNLITIRNSFEHSRGTISNYCGFDSEYANL